MPLTLPSEVWLMIATYLPHLPNEPLWRPWQEYRKVNKLFRAIIERYYMISILPATVLTTNFETEFASNPIGRSPLVASFRFGGFKDTSNSVAMLRYASKPLPYFVVDPLSQMTMLQSPGDAEKASFKNILLHRVVKTRQSSHPGISPDECVLFAYDQPDISRRAVTELLPLDLAFDPINMAYLFDWRKYFSQVLWERKSGSRRWRSVKCSIKPEVYNFLSSGSKYLTDYVIEPPKLSAPREQM